MSVTELENLSFDINFTIAALNAKIEGREHPPEWIKHYEEAIKCIIERKILDVYRPKSHLVQVQYLAQEQYYHAQSVYEKANKAKKIKLDSTESERTLRYILEDINEHLRIMRFRLDLQAGS